MRLSSVGDRNCKRAGGVGAGGELSAITLVPRGFQINPCLFGFFIKIKIAPIPVPARCLRCGGDCVSTPPGWFVSRRRARDRLTGRYRPIQNRARPRKRAAPGLRQSLHRKLPGHGCSCSAAIASPVKCMGFHLLVALSCRAKCSIRAGISSRRLRNGGRRRGKTKTR